MRVSFDFDDTLDQQDVWEYALDLINRGVDVFIVTARLDDDNVEREYGLRVLNGKYIIPDWAGNKDLYKIAKALDIPKNQIVFTNLMGKGAWFKRHPNFEWHLDDSTKQLFDVENMSSVPAINVLNPNWKERCESIIQKRDKHHYLGK